jgi:nucleoside-diphosphate-sugar epimerase
MKILVTGAAGYIGTRLCEVLAHSGYEVIAVDNLYYDQWHLVSKVMSHPNIQFHKLDVSNGIPYSLLDSADIIFPLAALVGAPLCAKEPTLSENINVYQISHLVENVSPNQLIIYPNSNSGLGQVDGIADENTPRNSVSLYGKQKDKAEDIVMQHSNSIVFRLATLFGVSWRTRVDLLVNSMVNEGMKDGEIVVFDPQYKRNFIHINDVVSAFIFAMNYQSIMKGQAYNLGNDECNMTKGELADKIGEYLSVPVSVGTGKDPDSRDYLVSSAKLMNLGYRPVVNLDAGIRELFNFYQFLPCTHLRKEILRANRNY